MSMTRDQARAMFADARLDYSVLTTPNVRRLRTLINQRMAQSGCMKGTLRCRQRGVIRQERGGLFAEIKCKAFYFEDREAVSFNTDGFIGFAGWADEKNIQPVLAGFADWVKELGGAKP